MPVDVRSLSLSILGGLALILAMQYAQSVLIPIVLGLLLSYALSPLVGALARYHVPRFAGAAIAVSLLVGSLGLGVYTLSDEATAIVANIPDASRRIRDRVTAQRRQNTTIISQVQEAAKEIEKTADAATTAPDDARPRGNQVQRVQIVEPAFRASDYLWIGGMGLFGFLGQFAMILFLVFFLLVTGDLYKRKMVKIAGPTLSKKKVTVQILDEINKQIESFIKVQVITSLVVAVATGFALWMFGVDNFAMWGLLAGLFNSIPYMGPLLVTGGLALVAFMQFNDIARQRLRQRRCVRDHEPRGISPDADDDGARRANESGGDLRRAAVLVLDVGRVGHRSSPCRC